MAKSKTKKLTFNMLAAEVQSKEPASVTVRGFEDQPLMVQRTLTLNNAIEFVRNTVSMVVDEESGEYLPEVFDFALKLNVLMSYAGIPVPKDFNKAYKVIYESNLYESVMEVINKEQYYILEDAIEDRVKYLRDTFVASAAAQLNKLVQKMDNVMNESTSALGQINSTDFLKALDSMQNIVDASNGERQDGRTGEIVPFSKE